MALEEQLARERQKNELLKNQVKILEELLENRESLIAKLEEDLERYKNGYKLACEMHGLDEKLIAHYKLMIDKLTAVAEGKN